MKFDKTFIAIRERGILEIFDLSLHVVKDHFNQIFWLLVIGAAPWIAIDLYFVHWMTIDYDTPQLYGWVMALLVISQAQVGTTFVTHYLGQAMFVGRPGIWETVRNVLKTPLFFIWLHGGLRTVIPTLLFASILTQDNPDNILLASTFLIPFSVFIGVIVRAVRPYVSEILLLEKTPIRKKEDGQINFGRRSSSLHGAAGADLFGRFITSSILAFPVFVSFYSSFVVVDQVLNIRANSEFSYIPYYFVLALWLVAGLMSVIRFLSYIDLRIRQEGWAVELRMRAEGSRLAEAFE